MKWLTVLLCIALAGPVLADPVDPDPDGIGIYFEPGAGNGSWCATAPEGSLVTAYLCLTRASDISGFTAWEAAVETSAPGALVGFNILGGGINTATAPEMVVTLDTPLPFQLSTILAEITVDVVWEWSVGLRVLPAASPQGPVNLPGYATVDDPVNFQPLQYSWGWNQATESPNWCATINDDNCLSQPGVPTEERSWESVKSLYR